MRSVHFGLSTAGDEEIGKDTQSFDKARLKIGGDLPGRRNNASDRREVTSSPGTTHLSSGVELQCSSSASPEPARYDCGAPGSAIKTQFRGTETVILRYRITPWWSPWRKNGPGSASLLSSAPPVGPGISTLSWYIFPSRSTVTRRPTRVMSKAVHFRSPSSAPAGGG